MFNGTTLFYYIILTYRINIVYFKGGQVNNIHFSGVYWTYDRNNYLLHAISCFLLNKICQNLVLVSLKKTF